MEVARRIPQAVSFKSGLAAGHSVISICFFFENRESI